MASILFSLLLLSELVFVQPTGSSLAGRTPFLLETDVQEKDILGLEVFIKETSVAYFEKKPFQTELDLSFYPQGKLEIKAILYLFSGEEIRQTKIMENHIGFYQEDVHLVRFPVFVSGNRHFERKDFTVFCEGEPQKIEYVHSGEQPLLLVVMLDLSGSMERRVPMLHHGVLALAKQLKKEDHIQVIGFNHRVFEICPPTKDRTLLKKRLALMEATGATNLYGALWSGLRIAAKTSQRRAVLIFTDGAHDLDGEKDVYKKTFDNCIEFAKEYGVPVYPMGLGVGIKPKLLERLARETGAKSFLLKSVKSAPRAFQEIGQDMESQYLVCFYADFRKTGVYAMEVKVSGQGASVLRYPKQLVFKSPSL